MTPTEFRATLEALGLRQIDAARLLGVGSRTCKEWASWRGQGVTSEPAARFLRFLHRTGTKPETVAAILELEP